MSLKSAILILFAEGAAASQFLSSDTSVWLVTP